MAKVVEAVDPQAAWATMSWRSLISIGLIGVLIGVVTYALNLVLLHLVFEPIMCRDSLALVRCDSKESLSAGVAIVLASMVGLVFLVRERVYRPLLVILAVALSMWGIFVAVAGLPWLLATVVVALAFALCYMLFAWLVQPNSLAISLILATLAVVAVRLVLTV